MSNDINLLSDINRGREKEEKSVKILNILCFASLFFVGLASITVFLLSRQFSVASIETQQKSVLQKLTTLRKKEAKIFIISNRLKGISDILAKRTDYYKIINGILQKVPQEISVDKLAISDNKISLMLSSNSLFSTNILIDNLVEMARRKEIITSITLSSLTLNEKTSRYSISLDADINL